MSKPEARKATPASKPAERQAPATAKRPERTEERRAHGQLFAPGFAVPSVPVAPAVASGVSQLAGGGRKLWENFWGGRDRPTSLNASPLGAEGGKEEIQQNDAAESTTKGRGEISKVKEEDLPAILKFSEEASEINARKHGFSYGMRWYEEAKATLVDNPKDLKSLATHTFKWVPRGDNEGDEENPSLIQGMISMVQPAVPLKAMGLIVTKIESIRPGVGTELILRGVQQSIDTPPHGGGDLLAIFPAEVDKSTGTFFKKLGFRKRNKIADPNVLEFARGNNVYHLSLAAAIKLIQRGEHSD